MRTAKYFLDSNIILYLFDSNASKRAIAEELLSTFPIINPQVLIEVANVCKRKLGFSKDQVCQLWLDLLNDCTCTDVTEQTMCTAAGLVKRYDMQLFDAILIAGALESECPVFYSEDMQDGMLIDGKLRILNPFR
ncbi:PIN domain-containing protein [Dyadobacter crusticola]|uniref:PIN domain-containing protein n=1 Tax=Dyadobacter crusticola TaxID=292407 RepID=UPI0004E224E9|nr:PIN domain-containing protein [Dyadobacter crusticola]